MSTGLAIFTLIHVIISLVGIVSGFVVVYGLLMSMRLCRWTATFLTTTVLTSVTGFFFPVQHLMPSHVVGIISLVLLAIAIYARYPRNLAHAWRGIYVVTGMLALYLNVFVLIVQLFAKVPALKAIAPHQNEPPFKLTQLAVLLIFITLIAACMVRFHPHAEPEMVPV